MNAKYYVRNPINGKNYGPFQFYQTASKVAEKIDDRYGEVVAEIHEDLAKKGTKVRGSSFVRRERTI